MTLGAGEVAAVTWGVIGCGGDAGCRRLQPVLSPDRERAGYGLPSGNAVPELEATREGARQDGKGRMPGVVRGLLYVRQKFFEPRCCFEGSPSLRFMDTARTADVTKNGIQSIGWEGEAWIRPSRRMKAAR